jgi:hypothetical protein
MEIVIYILIGLFSILGLVGGFLVIKDTQDAKKILKGITCVLLALTMSCASTFGTPGNQTPKQRKTDKIVGKTILVTGAIIIALVVANNYDTDK